jgi:HEAT repeat protein
VAGLCRAGCWAFATTLALVNPGGLAGAVGLGVLASASAAWAAPQPTKGGAKGPGAKRPATTGRKGKSAAQPVALVKTLPAAELDALATAVAGEDETAAAAAAKQLGDSGASNATDPLLQTLAVGTTPAIAAEIVTAVGKLKDPKALQLVTLYAGNRNLPVRIAAVKALASIADDRVVDTLLERLGDAAPEVRAAAADALAERKETRAQERLFALVTRNDAGAAGALGTVIASDAIPRVAELHGRVEGSVLAVVFGEFLKRTDVPERLRLDVIHTLGRIEGAAATTALVEYLASIP